MGGARLTRRVATVALGRAANTLALLAVYAILARAWAADELGAYLVIWTVVSALAPVFLLGLPTALLYFFPRLSAEGRRRLVWQTVLCLSASAVVLVGLLWLWGRGAAAWLGGGAGAAVDPRLPGYLLAFLPYAFALVAGGFVESALVASDRSGAQAALAVAAAAGMVLCALAVPALSLDVAQALLLFSGVGVARLLVGLLLILRRAGPPLPRAGCWAGVQAYLGYAAPIWLSDTVGGLSRYVDRLVVVRYFPVATFAHYQLGAIEVPISLLLTAVATVLVPEVSGLYQEGRRQEIGRLWHRAVGRLALGVIPLFCFLLAFADSVVILLFTNRYAESCWVFRILVLALPVRCAVYNPLLVGMGRARWALWGSLGDLAVNALLSVTLVHLLLERAAAWAFLGPAAATVIATYLQVAGLVWLIARHLNWNLKAVLPWQRLLRIGVFSALAAVAALGAGAWGATHAARLALGGVAFVAVLAGLLWLHREERGEVRALLAVLPGR